MVKFHNVYKEAKNYNVNTGRKKLINANKIGGSSPRLIKYANGRELTEIFGELGDTVVNCL